MAAIPRLKLDIDFAKQQKDICILNEQCPSRVLFVSEIIFNFVMLLDK